MNSSWFLMNSVLLIAVVTFSIKTTGMPDFYKMQIFIGSLINSNCLQDLQDSSGVDVVQPLRTSWSSSALLCCHGAASSCLGKSFYLHQPSAQGCLVSKSLGFPYEVFCSKDLFPANISTKEHKSVGVLF
jgi:hypothetical protein